MRLAERKNRMTFVRVLGATILSFCAIAGVSQQRPTPSPPARGQLVDLNGHRLHMDCAGKGSPTVILESGFEEFSFDWTLVQSRVATFTKVCSYDRAG
jgi:hypothetical protein